ncbi:MAG: glycosyltransferase family protein [Bacteroidales bacterium]|nr:glycosyltransferase family protein [Bacteroidales bacterium]MDT8430296.1 glycosyltransferase family protein [Bacteroidales bacterium]
MKVALVIQGEGKGHFSQAMEAMQLLHAQGDEITGCYLGRSLFREMPAYFRKASPLPLKTFLSPNFLRTPDRKGIHIFFSLLLNVLLTPIYLFEVGRLGIMLRRNGSDHVLNFYDPVGALAGKWMKRSSRKTVISHHFYLSHPDFIHPHGMERAFFWLQLMNALMMRQADEVFALSFRKGATHGRIRVVPPLVPGKLGSVHEREAAGIDTPGCRNPGAEVLDHMATEQDHMLQEWDEMVHGPDKMAKVRDPDLCYFLNPGFAEEMVRYYRDRPELKADLFTEATLPSQPPVNVRIHRPDREKFLSAMQHAGRVICTAGFDTVAEAFRLGIPVFVIPSENHYEQYCNALDAARTGMAYQLDSLAELDEAVFEPKSNTKYIKWLETGHDELFRRT